ncbi:MAG: riboflavin kinase [Streptosporangiaceae bacterium]
MQIVTGSPDSELHAAPVTVAVGEFDGVHAGHRAVLAELRRQASAAQCPAAVVLVNPRIPGYGTRLACPAERLELLDQLGVDFVVRPVLPPGARRSGRLLYEQLLGRTLRTRVAVHRAGSRQAGDSPDAAQLVALVGAAHGFAVVTVPVVTGISGTRIRSVLARGDLAIAAAMLGRSYSVRGRVVRGDGRGRQLGYATANVALAPNVALPGDGVFAGSYERPGGPARPSMIALGHRPTFYDGGGQRLLEAHLLDCDEYLYGEAARVSGRAAVPGRRIPCPDQGPAPVRVGR